MFRFTKKLLTVSLTTITNVVNASSHTKCVLLSNQECTAQPTIINLHLIEYTQGLHYYPFPVNLDRCVGSCNTLNDLCNKVCVINKTEDSNLSVFNMIAGINELKTLTKHMTCKCKCKLMVESVIQIKSGITINLDASAKNIIYVKKIIFGILLHAVVKMVNTEQVLLTIQ